MKYTEACAVRAGQLIERRCETKKVGAEKETEEPHLSIPEDMSCTGVILEKLP